MGIMILIINGFEVDDPEYAGQASGMWSVLKALGSLFSG